MGLNVYSASNFSGGRHLNSWSCPTRLCKLTLNGKIGRSHEVQVTFFEISISGICVFCNADCSSGITVSLLVHACPSFVFNFSGMQGEQRVDTYLKEKVLIFMMKGDIQNSLSITIYYNKDVSWWTHLFVALTFIFRFYCPMTNVIGSEFYHLSVSLRIEQKLAYWAPNEWCEQLLVHDGPPIIRDIWT